MGQFSWLYSDNGEQMLKDQKVDSYLLVPPPFQKEYGKHILETCYDGYGNFGNYDVYELVVRWNKAYLNEGMLIKPQRERWGNSKQDEIWFLGAMEKYHKTVQELKDYQILSDTEMKEKYGDDYEREIGVDIACYDEQNVALPFPIKITSKPMEYNLAVASQKSPY